MRGKRSKAYRKLMTVYANNFGFREPYQVLVDPTIIADSTKYKMDLAGGLERTLQGQVKPMITQCCIRHLYATDNQTLINLAKTFERRRCNHSISDAPLSPLDCMLSVVIPSEESPVPNKHRYVVATDDQDMREKFREYPGVPGIHIVRSVMVLDQVSDATVEWREQQEKGKLRSGLKDKAPSKKRKRENDEDEEMKDGDESGSESDGDDKPTGEKGTSAKEAPKKKKVYGKKQPNPLSMMKKKKKPPTKPTAKTGKSANTDAELPKNKRKRKRTHATSGSATGDTGDTKDVSGGAPAQADA